VNPELSTALHLLGVFSQLSVLGLGGGKGIIPQMHREAVTVFHWVTSAQFTQFYTIGKLVPGPTTIFAALVGYAAMPSAPVLGAVVATIAMFVPSSAIMIGAGALWSRLGASPWRTVVSRGMAPAIVGLVWSSVWTISRGTAAGPLAYTMTIVVAILMLRTKLSAPLLVLASGIAGVVALR
jgi:chromate transporter